MARPIFNLNLFSNVAFPDPGRNLAGHAARSFVEAFDPDASHDLRIRLFCDPNPNPDAFAPWVGAVRAALPGREVEAIRTRGLADGYLKSLDLSEGTFACQLEHDFVFRPRAIRHDLAALAEGMARGRIVHLRFNKRWNRAQGYDAFMTEQDVPGLPCCRVPGRSNNPHLLDLDHARRRVAPFIDRAAEKAGGIEGRVELYAGGGHVYGGLGHPATAGHLDGRGIRLRDGIRRRLWLALGRAPS
jgi:hypothetical protein